MRRRNRDNEKNPNKLKRCVEKSKPRTRSKRNWHRRRNRINWKAG
jgi:hypothetical protein